VAQKVRPKLNLSIDNISLDDDKGDASFLNSEGLNAEENSALFNTLNQKHREPDTNLSSEFLTDENADEETNYLKTIDGLRIEVQGNFE